MQSRGYSYSRYEETKISSQFKDDTAVHLNDLLLNCHSEIESFLPTFMDKFYGFIYPQYNHKYPSLQTINRHELSQAKIQKTNIGQGYHVWHCEDTHAFSGRVLSWILYLNDVEDGGETEFLFQKTRVKPKAGTFVLWPAYFTHFHRGNPPLSNEKYVLTGWVNYSYEKDLQGQFHISDEVMSKINNQENEQRIQFKYR